MTKIESNKALVNAPIETVYTFLQDLNNYNLLLPKDKISDWQSSEDQFSCKIQNTYKIALNKINETANQQIQLKADDSSPLKFNLNVNIAEVNGQTEVHLLGEADLNPFLKMMVMKPLRNLFDYMAGRLVKIHEQA